MTVKILLTAAVLTVAPGLALAMCNGHSETASASCASGLVWDTASGTCVSTPSS